MGDVITLRTQTTLDIPPERVTECAAQTEFEYVMVVGKTKAGEAYVASSTGCMAENILTLRAAADWLEKRLNRLFD